MKNLVILILLIAVPLIAQDSLKAKKDQKRKGHSRVFVDKNGDGYNDNAPDHDNDGIPNGLDPDYIKLKQNKQKSKLPYVDKNGDGINDNLQFGQPGLNRYGNPKRNVVPQRSGKEGIKKQVKAGQNAKGKGG